MIVIMRDHGDYISVSSYIPIAIPLLQGVGPLNHSRYESKS